MGNNVMVINVLCVCASELLTLRTILNWSEAVTTNLSLELAHVAFENKVTEKMQPWGFASLDINEESHGDFFKKDPAI